MIPWTVACQAPRSMGFSRQEYWSGLPFPSPGDLPNPGIEPGSPALQADSLLLSHRKAEIHKSLKLCHILKLNIQVEGFPSGSVVKNPPAMQETQEKRV